MTDDDGLYTVRCYVCGHKIGKTDDASATTDICERCE